MKEYINNLWEKTIKPSLQKMIDSNEKDTKNIISSVEILEDSLLSSQEETSSKIRNSFIKEKNNNYISIIINYYVHPGV